MTATLHHEEPPPRRVRVELSPRGAIVVVLTVGSVWLLIQLWQVLLVVVTALMLVGTLNPFVERLEMRGIRRHHAVALVFVGVFALGAGVAAVAIPHLVSQLGDIVADFPKSQARLATQLEGWSFAAPLADRVRTLRLGAVTDKAAEYGLAYGRQAVEIGAYIVSTLFLALYIILDRDRLRGALFALVPRAYHLRLSRVLLNLETIVGGYMRGQAITSALMAAFAFVVLIVARVPNALALALFAGLVDVLPYIGALLACGPAFLAALPRGLPVALAVLGVLGAYQEFESRVIVPRIYGKVLRLPSAVVLVALLVGGKLLGILGALLALPLAAGGRMIIEELRVALPGEDIQDAEVRAKDEAAEAEFAYRAAGMPAREAAAIAAEIAHERQDEEEKDPRAASELPLTSGTKGAES